MTKRRTLADDDQVVLRDRTERMDAFADRLKAEHLRAMAESGPASGRTRDFGLCWTLEVLDCQSAKVEY